jgi:integration host factor subunit beta
MATTKKDLIDRIAERTGETHALAKTVVQHFFEEVTSELAQGNRLEFRGFGVFETKTTPARMAQNPRTLEKVEVPAKRRVVFKMGRMMREGLNGNTPSATASRVRRVSKGQLRNGYDSQERIHAPLEEAL